MGYDVRGNVNNKNGMLFDFDYGNRLRQSSSPNATERYRYDAHGRRVLASRIAGPADTLGVIFSQYASNGQLMFQRNERTGVSKDIDQIYLGGSLVAQRETPFGGGTATVTYQHTDALGSPVAVTNSAGQVIERMEHEPYGAQIGGTPKDGPGYTGHVFDLATGMNYMQQRYYDPGIGRFLSVDPVTAYDNGDMRFFNRYAYANNNPYRFTDPDGRQSYGYGTNQPAQILDCNQTSSCISLEQADAQVKQDARQVVGLIATTALIGATGGLAVESGAAAAAAKAVKSNTAKQVLCAALSIGCDGKNIGTNPESQMAEDATRVTEMFRRMVERLTKEPTTIPKPAPPKPSLPKPTKPPEPLPPPPRVPKPTTTP